MKLDESWIENERKGYDVPREANGMDILKFDEKRCFCDEEDVFVKDEEVSLDSL